MLTPAARLRSPGSGQLNSRIIEGDSHDAPRLLLHYLDLRFKSTEAVALQLGEANPRPSGP